MTTSFLPKDPKAYLREELALRKARRPHYSLRAFARDLEMSPSSLSEFLGGRQGMSRERAIWIGKKIQLSDQQIEHFCDLIEAEFGRSEPEKQAAQLRITKRSIDDDSRLKVDQFRLIADWYHFPILELLTLAERNISLNEVAELLDLELETVDLAVERMESLGLLQKVNDPASGRIRFKTSENQTLTGDEGNQRAIRHCHQGFFEMHSRALEDKSIQERESLSFTLALAQEDWPALKAELQRAVVEVLSKFANSEKPKDQVICCSTQAITLVPHENQENLRSLKL